MQNKGNGGDLPILGTVAVVDTLESLRAERDELRDTLRRVIGAALVVGVPLLVILLYFWVDHVTVRKITDLAGQRHAQPVQIGVNEYRIWVSTPTQTEDDGQTRRE